MVKKSLPDNLRKSMREIARHLGTTPSRMMDLVLADNDGRVYIFSSEYNEAVSRIAGGGFISIKPSGFSIEKAVENAKTEDDANG